MDGVPAPKIDTEGINDDIVVAVIWVGWLG
jgi:hypothetical protein